jgi:hypothetical protein
VVGIERREKERKRNEKDKNSGTHFWRGFVGPQKCRFGGEIWRGMQNAGPFRGSTGIEFLHKSSNFGAETHIEAHAGGSCSNRSYSGVVRLINHD